MKEQIFILIDDILSTLAAASELIFIIIFVTLVILNNYRERILQTVFNIEDQLAFGYGDGEINGISTGAPSGSGKMVLIHYISRLKNSSEAQIEISNIEIDYYLGSHRDEITILDSDWVETRSGSPHAEKQQQFRFPIPWSVIKELNDQPFLWIRIYMFVEPTFSLWKFTKSLPEIQLKHTTRLQFPNEVWVTDTQTLNELDWESAQGFINSR